MNQTRKQYLDALRKRRLALAKRRAKGESVQQIAASEGISRQAAHRLIREAK